MILIISNRSDLTCDLVVKLLGSKGNKFYRFNTDEFPANGIGNFSISNAGILESKIRLNDRTFDINFNEVKSIWYRRPVAPLISDSIKDSSMVEYLQKESYSYIRGLWYSTNAYWISHPDAIFRAEHKILQLKHAQEIGFVIPDTLITNNAKDVLQFYKKHFGKIIIKPIHSGFFDSKAPGYIFTSSITIEDLEYLTDTQYSPSIFQEKIEKIADIRCTVIGKKMFCARIEPQKKDHDALDWRDNNPEHLNYSVYYLPERIERLCIQLVEKLNLQFGAIDLALCQNGQHIFLEINPNGQWAWLEQILDLPISQEIVYLLEKNDNIK